MTQMRNYDEDWQPVAPGIEPSGGPPYGPLISWNLYKRFALQAELLRSGNENYASAIIAHPYSISPPLVDS